MKIFNYLVIVFLLTSCTVSQNTLKGDRSSSLRKTMQADAERYIIENFLKLSGDQFELLILDQESSITEGDGDYFNQQTVYSHGTKFGLVLSTYNRVFEYEGAFDNLHFSNEEAMSIEEFLRKFKADFKGSQERYLIQYNPNLGIELKKRYSKLIYVFWKDNKYRHEISASDWKECIQKLRALQEKEK